MDNLQINLFKEEPSFHAWLCDLGFIIGKHPQAFTDCFDYKDISDDIKDKFKGSSQSLSRMIKTLIPQQIEGKFDCLDDLVSYITKDTKFQDSSSMKQYKQIVMTGINQAIGFVIIKSHSEIEKYPDLMQIRSNLNATQRTRSLIYRSSHKGVHGEEIVEMVDEVYRTENKTVIDTNWFWQIVRYIMNRAISCQDAEALRLVIPAWDKINNVLLAQQSNVENPKLLSGID